METVLKQIYPTARKEHQCYFCGGIVNNPTNTIMEEKTLGESLEEQSTPLNGVLQSSLYSLYIINTLKDMRDIEFILNTNDVRNGSKFYNNRNNKRKHKK